MKKMTLTACLILTAMGLYAQSETKKERLYSNKFTVLAGLIQPLALNGGNVEINYTTKRMIFDYSHGFNLEPPAVGDFEDQSIELKLPFTTGFGIGYRINFFLDIRFEPKLHSFEVYYKGEPKTAANKITDYKTFTLGIGMYYRYFPFRNSDSKLLQGITTSSSIRLWPNVGSTLSNDEFSYDSKITGKRETLKAAGIGFNNTPLVVNIAIGYTFGGK
jgi:hypothetical protein